MIFEEGKISNGLRVATDRIPSVQSVTLGILVEAGSRDDPRGREGLAHFVEHAVFKGTGRRSYLDIARNIEKNGGYLDAYTTKEHICIFFRCLTRHLETSFDLLADLVSNPIFPPEEIEKEKEVVIEEISSVNDTPEELVFEEFDLRSFPRHPLGQQILGTEESVENISIDDLNLFMRHHFVPEKMLVTATGDVAHHEILELTERFLGGLRAAPIDAPLRAPFTAKDYRPFQKSLKKRISQSQIVLGTVISRHDPLHYSLMVLNSMLGNGMSSLLNLELREKRGLAYTAYSSLSFLEDLTALNIYTGTDTAKTEATLQLISELLQSSALSDPDPEEIETAKSKLLGSHIMGMEKMTRRMSHMAGDLSYFGHHIPPEEAAATIEAVTPSEVAQAADLILHEAPMSTLVHKPSR